MILIPRTPDQNPEAAACATDPDAHTDTALRPGRTEPRPGTVNAGDIARKPRAIATALQNLHGI